MEFCFPDRLFRFYAFCFDLLPSDLSESEKDQIINIYENDQDKNKRQNGSLRGGVDHHAGGKVQGDQYPRTMRASGSAHKSQLPGLRSGSGRTEESGNVLFDQGGERHGDIDRERTRQEGQERESGIDLCRTYRKVPRVHLAL